MNLFLKKEIKNLLKEYNIRPSKKLGQNFLIDKGAIKKIIEAAELKTKEIVLEIGPGVGTLTQEIAKKTKKVIAVEKDSKMLEILEKTLKNFNNIKIIQKDILGFQVSSFKFQEYKVVANLPFYLTGPIIRKFLETETLPKEMILVVQKEVAQRICAKPPRMSVLAVSVQIYAIPKIISYISKKSFWPQPKVDSAIIKIIPKNAEFLSQPNIKIQYFFKIVKAGFSQPRKQLANNLSKELKIDKKKTEQWLLKNKIIPSQRAETLTVEDWLKLLNNYDLCYT